MGGISHRRGVEVGVDSTQVFMENQVTSENEKNGGQVVIFYLCRVHHQHSILSICFYSL